MCPAYAGCMDEEPTSRLACLEAILPTLATKADMEALRAEVLQIANETHRWMIATVIGLFLGFSGLFLAMGNLYWKPQPVAPQMPQQPPAVIYLPVPPAVTLPQEKSPR